nr:hypothetical protein Iba_chr07aCG7740 [Ipomoea batatas]
MTRRPATSSLFDSIVVFSVLATPSISDKLVAAYSSSDVVDLALTTMSSSPFGPTAWRFLRPSLSSGDRRSAYWAEVTIVVWGTPFTNDVAAVKSCVTWFT